MKDKTKRVRLKYYQHHFGRNQIGITVRILLVLSSFTHQIKSSSTWCAWFMNEACSTAHGAPPRPPPAGSAVFTAAGSACAAPVPLRIRHLRPPPPTNGAAANCTRSSAAPAACGRSIRRCRISLGRARPTADPPPAAAAAREWGRQAPATAKCVEGGRRRDVAASRRREAGRSWRREAKGRGRRALEAAAAMLRRRKGRGRGKRREDCGMIS